MVHSAALGCIVVRSIHLSAAQCLAYKSDVPMAVEAVVSEASIHQSPCPCVGFYSLMIATVAAVVTTKLSGLLMWHLR